MKLVRLGLKDLTNSTGVGEASPSYSADDERIVFSRSAGALDAHVWVMHADGSHIRRLTNGDGDTVYDYMPTWSPTGKLIDLSSDESGHMRLYHTRKPGNGHGASRMAVIGGHSEQSEPTPSPNDSGRVAFRGAQRTGPANGLFIWDGGAATPIPLGMMDLASEPSWQPR